MSSRVGKSERHLRVLLVDDHGLVRAGIRALILMGAPDAVILEAGTAEQARKVFSEEIVDVAFLDLDLEGAESGIELLKRVRSEDIPARIVIVSATADYPTVIACLKAGASGYIPKAIEDPSALQKAVEVIMTGGVYLPGPFSESSPIDGQSESPKEDLIDLPPRLIEVLKCVCQGLPNKLIARKLGISEGTVRKTYMTELLRYFGVARRTALMYEVARRGIRLPLSLKDSI